MLRKLFEEVRTKGQIDLGKEVLLRDVLPIVYTGESDSEDSTTYYNSGGRSVLFQRGGDTYRVKGVDPFGYLTERVALSRQNRIENVRDAHGIMKQQLARGVERRDLGFNSEKPFGTFFLEQAECEVRALERLKAAYEQLGIENPCEPLFYKETGIQKNGRSTYQTAFRLPSLEADVRAHEFMFLLTERLDSCSPDEIAAKSKNISRLFGRFIYWAGVNVGIFAALGVLPISSSFYPQNWVIGRYKNGYGTFRVDHTSTKLTDSDSVVRELVQEREGLPFLLNEFSVYASRIQMAANPQQFLLPGQRNLKFSQILDLREGAAIDESLILEAHRKVFGMGLVSLAQGSLDPIPEEMFMEALE